MSTAPPVLEPLLPKRAIIGVGPIRTASTWLFSVLAETDLVEYTKKKEVGYFNDNYNLGPQWYRDQFTGHRRGVYVDVTPQYLDSLTCLERLVSDLPDAQVVVGLRDPDERIRSIFEMFYSGLGHDPSGEIYRPLFDRELHRQLLIAERVEFLARRLPRENLIFLRHEELCADSFAYAGLLLKRLGLNCRTPAVSHLRINSLYEPRDTAFARAAKAAFTAAKMFVPRALQLKAKVTVGQRVVMEKIRFENVLSPEAYDRLVGPHLSAIHDDARHVNAIAERFD